MRKVANGAVPAAGMVGDVCDSVVVRGRERVSSWRDVEGSYRRCARKPSQAQRNAESQFVSRGTLSHAQAQLYRGDTDYACLQAKLAYVLDRDIHIKSVRRGNAVRR